MSKSSYKIDENNRVKKADYDVGEIAGYKVENQKSDTRDARSPSPRKIMLSDNIIKKLPFCSDGPIDIVDTTYNAENNGGRLILRIGKNTKTFYPSIAKRGNEKRGNGKSMGSWIVKDSNYYKDDEANLATAKIRFTEAVRNHQNKVKVSRKEGDITIREYLESGKYEQDRLTTTTLRNQIAPVEKNVIKSILSQFEPWLDKELHEVSKEWPAEFKKHWEGRYIKFNEEGRVKDPGNFEAKQVELGTMRKYFSEFNAMFNICEKIGYIHSNKIKNFASLFPKKILKKGSVKTYNNLNYDDLMTFLFDESTRSPAYGKLIIAIMAVTGARNSEVYKNYIDNFDDQGDQIVMHIPAEICKTKEAGARAIEIKNNKVIEEIRKHLAEIPKNAKAHMFPSIVIPDQHTSDYAYRDLWKLVKAFFNLPVNGRMYSLRATFATRIATESGIDVAADITGDSLEIANSHYNNIDEKRRAEAIDKVLSNSVQLDEAPQRNNSNLTVLALPDAVPESIVKMFTMFKNGKEEPTKNHMLKTDWDKFVSLIKRQHDEKKLIDDDIGIWLLMQ